MELLLKFAVVAFGAWFMFGHVSDALTNGRAALRGADFTLAQPWRFSLALGLNLAFGFLLISAPIFPGAIFRIVPDRLIQLAGELAWLALLLTLAGYFTAAVRVIVFLATWPRCGR